MPSRSTPESVDPPSARTLVRGAVRARRAGLLRTLAAVVAAMVVAGAALAQQGALRVGIDIPVQLDPALASSDAEITVLNSIYDYLVDVDAANEIQPRLATAWQVSNDGLVYTFQLAEGVVFHDGSALTADDVVHTFDRLRDPDAGYPTADLYSNVVSVAATGELEVRFTLAETNPFFLYDLSDNHALIVDDGTSDYASSFNGTGPFVVDSYAAEDRMVLRANPDYFVPGKPGVAELELIFFGDQAAGVSAIRGGQLDIVLRMPTALFRSLQNVRGITPIQVATNGYDLVRLRTDRPPGDDPRVVEALKRSIDRAVIRDVVAEGFAAAGYDNPIGPLYEAYHLESPGIPAYDPARARELLAEAGYGDGLELELFTPDSGDRPALAQVLQQQLADGGFDVTIRVVPEGVYYSDAPNNWLDATFGITGWGSRPVPQFYLDVAVACDAVWNEAHYCDERVDALIELASTTLDEQARVEAYDEIQRILAAEGPYVIPYFFAQFAAAGDDVQGLEVKAFPGRTDLAAVTLE